MFMCNECSCLICLQGNEKEATQKGFSVFVCGLFKTPPKEKQNPVFLLVFFNHQTKGTLKEDKDALVSGISIPQPDFKVWEGLDATDTEHFVPKRKADIRFMVDTMWVCLGDPGGLFCTFPFKPELTKTNNCLKTPNLRATQHPYASSTIL